MQYITLEEKKVLLYGSYDVIIVGGGTAGAVAAISSGREGLKTLVVEQFGSLGGSQTVGLVNPMMHNKIEGNPYSSSIDEEICERMIQIGYGSGHGGPNKGWFDSQMLKVVLEEMVIEAGCDILYHTSLIDVLKEEEKIKAIIIHNKDGISAVKGSYFIDCTGDGDVAYYLGLPLESGDKNGMNQALSLRFQMTNIDCDRFGEYLESLGQEGTTRQPLLHTAAVRGKDWVLNSLFEEKIEQGVLEPQDLKYFQIFSVPGKPRDLAFNCPELGAKKNIVDATFLTQKQIEGKKAIMRLASFLQKYVPGFEEAYISDIAPMLGIRESRRVIAEYRLTGKDIVSYAKFEDGIARSNYPIDIHNGDQEEDLEYSEVGLSEQYYEIPYRSLVVDGIDNLLAAGRCTGSDFIAQSAIRIQQVCRAMGEATGIAAAYALEKKIPFRQVEGKEVRARMRERGGEI